MNGTIRTLGFAAAVAALSSGPRPALAQGPPPHETQRHEELVQKYDLDGDGKLSPAELRSALPSQPTEREPEAPRADSGTDSRLDSGAPQTELRHDAETQRILERFDANGNGTLDLKEMDALRKARAPEAGTPRSEETRPAQGSGLEPTSSAMPRKEIGTP